ncbi:MAG TPA: hypothetical protein VMR20_02085 [Verrucomicrobiae bacterium]|nr:hypothetical protein [Verrucomicrobiae bacterium]
MARRRSSRLYPIMIMASVLACWTASTDAQSRRHIKVVLETKQTGTTNQETVQGSGSVVIRRGTVQPSGRVTAAERQTTVQRSSGVFTLVLDGSESILSVATRVPQSQLAYFHNYAAGSGYIERRIVFQDVGTSLRVSAAALPDRPYPAAPNATHQLLLGGAPRRHRFHRSGHGADRAQWTAGVARRLDDELA